MLVSKIFRNLFIGWLDSFREGDSRGGWISLAFSAVIITLLCVNLYMIYDFIVANLL
jgi:hypothetical protein